MDVLLASSHMVIRSDTLRLCPFTSNSYSTSRACCNGWGLTLSSTQEFEEMLTNWSRMLQDIWGAKEEPASAGTKYIVLRAEVSNFSGPIRAGSTQLY